MKQNYKKNTVSLLCLLLFFIVIYTSSIQAQVKIVATTSDLASIAKDLGGESVIVEHLAPGNADLHYLSARPNFMLKVNKADILFLIGADLEVGWLPEVLNNSRNPRVIIGSKGYCDMSSNIQLLQRPTGTITRMMGDVHPLGNPHFWTDPMIGIKIAQKMVLCLSATSPENKDLYKKNLATFTKNATALTKKIQLLFKKHSSKKIISFHQDFVYIANRFGLNVVDQVEEKPGVPPTIARKNTLIEKMKNQNIKHLFITPWQDLGVSESLAEKAGAKVLVVPLQTDSIPNTETYFKTIETWAKLIDQALSN